MSAPLRYRLECGPKAIAAVTGLEPAEAAERLWGPRRLWNDAGRPHPAETGLLGTPPDAMVDALQRSGYGVEMWSGDGRLVADPEVLRRFVAGEVHERVVGGSRTEGAGPSDSPTEEESKAEPEPREYPTLAEWRDRRIGGGFWLVLVHNGEDAHVLATYGPKILAGGPPDVYDPWTVYRVYRVYKPEGVRA